MVTVAPSSGLAGPGDGVGAGVGVGVGAGDADVGAGELPPHAADPNGDHEQRNASGESKFQH